MIFNKLAIGTANWGKPYGLSNVKVSEDEQKRILDYCQCSGIDMIDTAIAYEWDWTNVSCYFNIILKIQKKDMPVNTTDVEQRIYLMAHKANEYRNIKVGGVSIYDLDDMKYIRGKGFDEYKEGDIIELPYSIFDRRFEGILSELKTFGMNIIVRSIFLQGKILERFKPWECIAFCLMNPWIDRVIIGVDSLEQLKEDLAPFHKMNSAEIHDINILDPRKWKGN